MYFIVLLNIFPFNFSAKHDIVRLTQQAQRETRRSKRMKTQHKPAKDCDFIQGRTNKLSAFHLKPNETSYRETINQLTMKRSDEGKYTARLFHKRWS